MSRQEGISQQSTLMALPDELLQMIFSSIKQEKNESTFALLQVNRRFRRIAFDTPSLWTQICNLQPRAYITAFARCAARSLDTARSLCFCERSAEKLRLLAARSDDIYVNLSDFISLLSSINHHWDEIRFHSCDSGDFEQLIETDYVPASVKKIEMSGWNCLRSLEEFEDFFDMKWAHTASIVFKGFNTVSWIMASALKTVDLTFDASEPRSMANIILVLSELKTTENLAMTWKEIRKERLADDRGVLEVFELPSVKSLRVQVLGGDHIICSNSVNFAKLFSNMDFPALRKLSILTNFTPVLTGNQLLRELVLRHGDPAGDGIGLPLLRSFSLRMQDGPYDLDGFEDLKNDLLCHMPGLERLYIEGPGIAAMSRDCLPVLTWNMDPTNDGVKLFPRMKSMVFDSWLRVDCWLLQGIRDDVFADTHSGRPPAGFERLVVARCPLVTDPLIVDSTYFIDFGKTLIIKDKVSHVLHSISILYSCSACSARTRTSMNSSSKIPTLTPKSPKHQVESENYIVLFFFLSATNLDRENCMLISYLSALL